MTGDDLPLDLIHAALAMVEANIPLSDALRQWEDAAEAKLVELAHEGDFVGYARLKTLLDGWRVPL